MVEWLLRLEPWQQALAGTAFTYFMTALGAGLVFFKEIKRSAKLDVRICFWCHDCCKFWSLLDPAITKQKKMEILLG